MVEYEWVISVSLLFMLCLFVVDVFVCLLLFFLVGGGGSSEVVRGVEDSAFMNTSIPARLR